VLLAAGAPGSQAIVPKLVSKEISDFSLGETFSQSSEPAFLNFVGVLSPFFLEHIPIYWLGEAEAASAFSVVCGAGDCAVVRQLLDARADPAATHALCSAASGGHVEVGSG
jgi:hypothetical protein